MNPVVDPKLRPRANPERKIIRDFFIGLLAIVILACGAYMLDLVGAIAELTGRPEIARIDTVAVVLMFSVWLVGIFLLRRLHDLRRLSSERAVVEKRALETQKMEPLARMASGLAHDFNNLLMAMLGFCDVAMRRPDAGDQVRKDLMEIKNVGDRASTLVARLLSFARRAPSKAEVLDINGVIADLDAVLKQLLGNSCELKTILCASAALVKADLTQVEEILVNLVLNAHDAMPEGGKLTVKTSVFRTGHTDVSKYPTLARGEYVSLSISDTGTGISTKHRDRIFDPFFSTKEKGTGLGLAMVHGIVQLNNGVIDLATEIGKGTTFTILLPAAPPGELPAVN